MTTVVVQASVYSGVCKWFDEDKGYGFIRVTDNPQDIFVHAKQLRKSGIDTPLQDGEKLEFQLNIGLKGQFATNIKRLNQTGT